MPLSKERNRERMKEFRLHKQLSPLSRVNPVQPKVPDMVDKPPDIDYVDADGYPVYGD